MDDQDGDTKLLIDYQSTTVYHTVIHKPISQKF